MEGCTPGPGLEFRVPTMYLVCTLGLRIPTYPFSRSAKVGTRYARHDALRKTESELVTTTFTTKTEVTARTPLKDEIENTRTYENCYH